MSTENAAPPANGSRPWRLIEASVQNFRRIQLASFKPRRGMNVVEGPNENGKSSFILGILDILKGGGMAGVDVVHHGADEAVITVHLSDGGDAHLYCKKVHKADGHWDLEVRESPDGRKLPNGSTVLKKIVGEFPELTSLIKTNGPGRIEMLLRAVGKKDELDAVNARIKQLREEREKLGTKRRDKVGELEECPIPPPETPDEKIDIQALLTIKNARAADKRAYEKAVATHKESVAALEAATKELDDVQNDADAFPDVIKAQRETVAELEAKLSLTDDNRNAKMVRQRQIEEHIAALQKELDAVRQEVADLNSSRSTTAAALESSRSTLANLESRPDELKLQLSECAKRVEHLTAVCKDSDPTKREWPETETESIDAQITSASTINENVANKKRRDKVAQEKRELDRQWNEFTERINDEESGKASLLSSIDWPYPGLGISEEHQDITVNGSLWDNFSDSQVVRVSVSLLMAGKPNFRFGVIRGIEHFDSNAKLEELNRLAVEHDFDIIVEKPTTTYDADALVIEDGVLVNGNGNGNGDGE